jgi:hypothetical protein
MNTVTSTTDEGLDFMVTEKDITNGLRLGMAFGKSLPQFRPSQIGGPVVVAILRTITEGFPLVGYKETAVVKTPEAEVLRNIYQRFLDGKSTAEQFSAAATPLLIKLWAEVEADDATETQELIDASEGQEPN